MRNRSHSRPATASCVHPNARADQYARSGEHTCAGGASQHEHPRGGREPDTFEGGNLAAHSGRGRSGSAARAGRTRAGRTGRGQSCRRRASPDNRAAWRRYPV